eukprot:6843554-Pyramimonas_sp.AAC.1
MGRRCRLASRRIGRAERRGGRGAPALRGAALDAALAAPWTALRFKGGSSGADWAGEADGAAFGFRG